MSTGDLSDSFQHREERRSSTRYVFRADIEIYWGSRIVWGQVLNISRYGMFIQLPENPPVHAEFQANLALNAPLRVICKVCRTVSNYGVGVAIAIQEQRNRERFDALLFALAQGADREGATVPVPAVEESVRAVSATAGASK
jgi:hypothetical protein